MEKRSRRRIRDLVTQAASQGLSENEIGCARISMMAKSMNALFTGRIQKRKTNPLHHSHLACNTRPVHTKGSKADVTLLNFDVRFTPESGHSPTRSGCLLWAKNGLRAMSAFPARDFTPTHDALGLVGITR